MVERETLRAGKDLLVVIESVNFNGGAHVATWAMIDALVARGWRVDVMTASEPTDAPQPRRLRLRQRTSRARIRGDLEMMGCGGEGWPRWGFLARSTEIRGRRRGAISRNLLAKGKVNMVYSAT